MLELRHVEIHEIAKILDIRKNNNGHTVLLLGSRAGGLYHSNSLYKNLEKFSNRAFNNMTQKDQFGACYEILNSGRFSERDINNILKEALINQDASIIEEYLAHLTKAGYFKEIISTNMDDLLEQAFSQAEMKEQIDYDVFFANHEGLKHYDSGTNTCRVLKVYGDVASRVYNINRRNLHDNDPLLKGILQKSLAKDVLIFGFDTIWDESLLQVLTANKTDSTLWFVNDEEPEEHRIQNILRGREARCVIGAEGSYDNFIPILHRYLLGYSIPSKDRFAELIVQHEVFQANMRKLQSSINTLQDTHEVLQQGMNSLQERLNTLQEQNGNLQETLVNLVNLQKAILAEIKKSQKRQRNGPDSLRNP